MNRLFRSVAKVVSLLLAVATVSLAAPIMNSAQAAGTVPGAPSNVSGVASGTTVTLTWTAPSSNGGSALTDYCVQYRSNVTFATNAFPGVAWTTFTHTASTSTTATIPGLNADQSYELRVAAKNVNGCGPWNNRILVAELTDTYGHNECVIRQDRSTLCKTFPVVIFDGTTPATRVIQIATQGQGVCLLFENGKIKCGGAENADGQLGDGTTALPSGSKWTDVLGIDGTTPAKTAVKVALGNNHACALMDNGQVQCWGRNSSGELGNGGTAASLVPAYVNSLTAASDATTAIDIAIADKGTCVILKDATVTCWGKLASDNLGVISYFDGDSDVKSAASFGDKPGPEGVFRSGALGSAYCILTVSKQVVCWGVNGYEMFNLGPRATNTGINQASIPTVVNGVSNVEMMAQGTSASCVLFTGGSVSCFGKRDRGQLGDGQSSMDSGLFPVTGLEGLTPQTTATSVSVVSPNGFCATLVEGDTVCWGQVTQTSRYTPAVIGHSELVRTSADSGGGGGGGGGGTAPNTPAIPRVVAGNGQVTVTVTANVGGVAPTLYAVFAVGVAPPGKSCVIMVPSASMSCVIAGLTNGTAYTFKAVAVAGATQSTASEATSAVTPSASGTSAPGAPRDVAIATRKAGTLGVMWDAPASPGSSAIAGYTVAWREVGKAWVAGNTKDVTVRTATVTGLTAGKSYEFRVNASNATSTGAWSTSTTGIVPVKAPAPQNLKGVAKGMQITVTWSKVTTPSHSPVVNYAVYCAVGAETPARAKVKATESTATVTVTQHKRYVCRVAANTAAGRGTDSAPIRVTIK